MRKYYAKYPAKNRDHVHDWRNKHANKNKPHGNRIHTTHTYREAIINFCLERDGSLCQLCLKPLVMEYVSIDHKIPVALGGLHRMNNLRLAHATCNSSAGLVVRQQVYGH